MWAARQPGGAGAEESCSHRRGASEAVSSFGSFFPLAPFLATSLPPSFALFLSWDAELGLLGCLIKETAYLSRRTLLWPDIRGMLPPKAFLYLRGRTPDVQLATWIKRLPCVCACLSVCLFKSPTGVAADRLINSSKSVYFCRVTKAGDLVCTHEKLFPSD